MAQQGYDDDLLRRWFSADEHDWKRKITEHDIRGISDVLRRGSRETWSRIPRIYSVLRKIGQINAIEAFVDNGITDLSFPFTKSTLPEALCDHSARLKFLELQHLVYNTQALFLERHARHGHFQDPSEVPLKRLGDLGKGGFGFVDHVVSTISNREYARKVILRGKTFRKDKEVLRAFVKELEGLKRLSHRHLVSLVGSYTDRKYVAIVMAPVADCNLETLLEKSEPGARPQPFLRSFFGCLASALGYLHDSSIRHKDIKPSNVLIKHDQVYLTDIGTCLDWSELDNSITSTAPPTTPRYCSPEVMAYTERSSMSDMWSLGCVFLEMWTVVKQHTLEEMKLHLSNHGTRTKDYHSNLDGFKGWLEVLSRTPGPSCDQLPSEWISNLLQPQSSLRWSIHTLEDRIREATLDPSTRFAFIGLCCLDHNDDTSSSNGSYWSHNNAENVDTVVPHLLRSSRSVSLASLKVNRKSSKLVQRAGSPVVLHEVQGVTNFSGSEYQLGTAGVDAVKSHAHNAETTSSAKHDLSPTGDNPLFGCEGDIWEGPSGMNSATAQLSQHCVDERGGLFEPRTKLDGVEGGHLIDRDQQPNSPDVSALSADPTCTSHLQNTLTSKVTCDSPRLQQLIDVEVTEPPYTSPGRPLSRQSETMNNLQRRAKHSSEPPPQNKGEARTPEAPHVGPSFNGEVDTHISSNTFGSPPDVVRNSSFRRSDSASNPSHWSVTFLDDFELGELLADRPGSSEAKWEKIYLNGDARYVQQFRGDSSLRGSTQALRPMPNPALPAVMLQDEHHHLDPAGSAQKASSVRVRSIVSMPDNRSDTSGRSRSRQQHNVFGMSSDHDTQRSIIPRVMEETEQQQQDPFPTRGTETTHRVKAQHVLNEQEHEPGQQYNIAERTMSILTHGTFHNSELSQRVPAQVSTELRDTQSQSEQSKQKHNSRSSSAVGISKISRWSQTTSNSPKTLLRPENSTHPSSNSGPSRVSFDDSKSEERSNGGVQGALRQAPRPAPQPNEYLLEADKYPWRDIPYPNAIFRSTPEGKTTTMARSIHQRNAIGSQEVNKPPPSGREEAQKTPRSSASDRSQRSQDMPVTGLRRQGATQMPTQLRDGPPDFTSVTLPPPTPMRSIASFRQPRNVIVDAVSLESSPGSVKAKRSSSPAWSRTADAGSSSAINNPRLLATVEDAIERLILPELNALKEEERISRSRKKLEHMSHEASGNRKSANNQETAEISRGSSPQRRPKSSCTRKVVLDRHGDDVLSDDPSSKAQRSGPVMASHQSQVERTLTERSNDGKSTDKPSSTSLKDLTVTGLMTTLRNRARREKKGRERKHSSFYTSRIERSRYASILGSLEESSIDDSK
ncbi:hypothetical protein FB567DRAFT_530014 [Paraphoma chrysanthemicola]|uniref:Protein kinase domain-containing protein n=1 Tax=Paraphoma chrysanthemicola TaxID=798071 RepID=A0A8K0R1Z5_9PLEO|nr:hypothetical protein FB567DRAFT_530014 [Paraphoma chrysanthemicola]